MATIHHRTVPDVQDVVVEPEVVRSSAARKALAVLRYGFGLTFLWAFFDKTFALGFHTGWTTNPETGAETLDRFGDAAWINGGSPTEGFLLYGVPEGNPFREIFNSMAGAAWADWLFMIGLLGIGLALTLGIGMRIAAATGALLYLLMYAASFPLENNPVVDDHLLGAISVIVLALTLSGDTWGAGKAWAKSHLVRRYPVLR
jgi:thiosulfate dehydrogenase [quinone] large subunit